MGRFNKYRSAWKTALKEALAERDGLFCGICQQPVASSKEMTVDHIIPISLGGEHDAFRNMQLAHDQCNAKKGNELNILINPLMDQQPRDRADNGN